VTKAECEKDGYRNRICTICGETETQVIAKTGHNFGSYTVTVQPTCTTPGKETSTCQNDPHHMIERDVPPLGHDYGDWQDEVKATCTTPGTAIRVCSRDASHIERKTVPALGHDYSYTDQPEATCTTSGVRTYTCKNDPSHTYQETVAPLGHDFGEWTVSVAPTCTETGTEIRTCKRDSSHTETRTAAALNHNWGPWEVTQKPTCTESGSQKRTCLRDSSHTETQTVKPTGHQHTKWVITKQPTYTEEGERKLYCDDCGELIRTEIMKVRGLYGRTICVIGPRLRDSNLSPYNSDNWYMYTPFDASKDGRQTFKMIGSNEHEVGSATLTVRDGTVTFDYKVYPNVDITLEFFTIVNQMGDLHEYEPEALSSYAMVPGRAYSIEDDFGGDTNLVLYFCSRGDYTINRNVKDAELGKPYYMQLVRSMMSIMDK